MVRDEFPGALLLTPGANLGFAAANNLGLAQCQGEFVVLLNSDTELEDDSLSRGASWMRAHPEVGALSPRLIGFDGQPQRALYRFPTIGRRWRAALRLPTGPEPTGEAADGWLAGTALMIRREALESVGGGLDDAFFMYWEDADLSMRLRRAGWTLAEFPDGHVKHFGGASGGGLDSARRGDLHAWYVWGEHRWFAKHRPRLESAALWFLDVLEVPRKLARAAIREGRRYEAVQARVQARVLRGRLTGGAPSRPTATSPASAPLGLVRSTPATAGSRG